MAIKSPFYFWLFIGLGIRITLSATHSIWAHPDEWFQTVEFAKFLVHGTLSNTQEVGLHLRNLSWPAMLSVPLGIAHALSPDWVWLRVFLVQVFSGLLDFGILWGFFELFKKTSGSFPVLKKSEHVALALLILPSFFALDSIRPSQEHLATAVFWVVLGCLSRRWFFWAGVMSIGIGAFKYPAFLLTLGIFLSVGFCSLRESKGGREFGRYALGLVAGAVIFGAADWVIYGRPWESLWMFLQYNVWSGLGAKNFGTQSALEQYGNYFRGHWFGIFLPLAVMGVPFALVGVWRGLKEWAPWAWAGILYCVGHLLIGHKEPRFMVPLEVLCVWSAWMGWGVFWSQPHAFTVPQGLKKASYLVFKSIMVVNALLLLRAFWGETWVANGTYFEVNRHLKKFPEVAAVITVKRPLSLYIPSSLPAFGFFASERRAPSFDQASTRPLIWIEREPDQAGDGFLLHLHRPDIEWEKEGCTLERSGFLSVLPQSRWNWALERGYARGSWYHCPLRALSVFKKQETRSVLASSIPPITKLPSLRASLDEILRISAGANPGVGDGTFGDIP